MALVMTLLAVVGMLAGIAALLWFSTLLEARQLGPVPGAGLDAMVEERESVEAILPAA